MKLKANSFILLALLALTALTFGGCSAPPTVGVVIVDAKGAPVKAANTKIVVTNNGALLGGASTDATGNAKLNFGLKYPAVITASDATGDKFSVVTLLKADDVTDPIKIIEGPQIIKALP